MAKMCAITAAPSFVLKSIIQLLFLKTMYLEIHYYVCTQEYSIMYIFHFTTQNIKKTYTQGLQLKIILTATLSHS